jgi:hypothetical protein
VSTEAFARLFAEQAALRGTVLRTLGLQELGGRPDSASMERMLAR